MNFSFANLNPGDTQKPCLITKKQSYDFYQISNIIFARLSAWDNKLGTRLDQQKYIALLAQNKLENIVDLYALMMSGVTTVLIHPKLTYQERNKLLNQSPAQIILDSQSLAPIKNISYKTFGACDYFSPNSSEQILAMVATSGSTGKPKLVCLSRRSFLASYQAHTRHLGWEETDRWLLCMPFAHVGGLSILTRCLLAKRPVVLYSESKFEPELFVRYVRKYKVSLISLVPTMLYRLLEAGCHLPKHVRAILLGGAPARGELLKKAWSLNWPVLPTYGMSETCSQIVTADPQKFDSFNENEAVGKPLPGVNLKIKNKQIWVKGNMLFSGYWRNDNLDNSVFDTEGWFDTRDNGKIDKDGFLHVFGRNKDMIICGGENIYPYEVEIELDRIPGVIQSCAFAVPDEKWGQIIAAILVSRLSLAQLASDLNKVSAFKRPKLVAITSQKLEKDKINRQELAEVYKKQLKSW